MASTPFNASLIPAINPSSVYAADDPTLLDLDEIVLTHNIIQSRIRELAAEIAQDYGGRPIQPVVIMNGAFRFYSDLSKAMVGAGADLADPVLLRAQSYEGDRSSGRVNIFLHPQSPKSLEGCAGSDLLSVEDIFDTGYTLAALHPMFKRVGSSVRGVVLLDKPAGRKVSPPEEITRYMGFVVPNKFLIGYGLDFEQEFRELDCIGVLSKYGFERVMALKTGSAQ